MLDRPQIDILGLVDIQGKLAHVAAENSQISVFVVYLGEAGLDEKLLGAVGHEDGGDVHVYGFCGVVHALEQEL